MLRASLQSVHSRWLTAAGPSKGFERFFPKGSKLNKYVPALLAELALCGNHCMSFSTFVDQLLGGVVLTSRRCRVNDEFLRFFKKYVSLWCPDSSPVIWNLSHRP